MYYKIKLCAIELLIMKMAIMLLVISNVIIWGIGVKIFNHLSCAQFNFRKYKRSE